MINVDFEKEVIHTIKFDTEQIKDILIEALRITGHDIPDGVDLEVDEQPDFEVIMRFTQEELDEYLKDKEELTEETTEHWSTDAEEVNTEGTEGTCTGCPAEK